MRTWVVSVVDRENKRSKLTRTGPTEDFVIRDLTQTGYFIVDIKPADLAAGGAGQGKLGAKVVLEFTQTMNLLLASGLNFKQAIKVARSVLASSRALALVVEVDASLDKGTSLLTALEPYKASFPPLYLGLIGIGEKTGNLAPIFARLADYLNVRKAISDKLTNALVYPTIVLSMAIVGVILLTVFVFPQLTSIVSSLNKDTSRAFAANMAAFQTGFAFFLGALAVVIAAVVVVRIRKKQDAQFGLQVDSLVWKLPVVKGFLEVFHCLNLSFALETLVRAGYTVDASLDQAASAASNGYFKAAILKVRESVLRGMGLSEAFRQTGAFPDRWNTWVAVGEGANNLGQVFQQLREFYQQEMENSSVRLMNAVEPAMILGVGVLIIVLILNFITPVFSLLGSVV